MRTTYVVACNGTVLCWGCFLLQSRIWKSSVSCTWTSCKTVARIHRNGWTIPSVHCDTGQTILAGYPKILFPVISDGDQTVLFFISLVVDIVNLWVVQCPCEIEIKSFVGLVKRNLGAIS